MNSKQYATINGYIRQRQPQIKSIIEMDSGKWKALIKALRESLKQ